MLHAVSPLTQGGHRCKYCRGPVHGALCANSEPCEGADRGVAGPPRHSCYICKEKPPVVPAQESDETSEEDEVEEVQPAALERYSDSDDPVIKSVVRKKVAKPPPPPTMPGCCSKTLCFMPHRPLTQGATAQSTVLCAQTWSHGRRRSWSRRTCTIFLPQLQNSNR